MAEFIRGKVSEAKRETHTITIGSTSTSHDIFGKANVTGSVDTKLITNTTFKLENDNRTFFLEGEELIEKDDDVGLYAQVNKNGFHKVLLCKNFTKAWIKDYNGLTTGFFGLIGGVFGMAIFAYIIYLILNSFVFDNKFLGNIVCFIIFIILEFLTIYGGLKGLKLKKQIKNMT